MRYLLIACLLSGCCTPSAKTHADSLVRVEPTLIDGDPCLLLTYDDDSSHALCVRERYEPASQTPSGQSI